MRGPNLDDIASRMTGDQIIRQVLQGGGNMPAYGNALSPPETTALVQFLLTLRSGYLPPAIDASRKVATAGEQTRTPDTSTSTSP
jgi:ubiquinol-cytochrome c reductase cytochrome b subunit